MAVCPYPFVHIHVMNTKRTISLALLIFTTMFCLFNPLSAQTPESEETLRKAITAGALLVDVRSPEEFTSGSAQGAINIPLDQLPQHLETLRQREGAIIVFCRSGGRASRAQKLLQEAGLGQVISGTTWQRVQSIIENLPQTKEPQGNCHQK